MGEHDQHRAEIAPAEGRVSGGGSNALGRHRHHHRHRDLQPEPQEIHPRERQHLREGRHCADHLQVPRCADGRLRGLPHQVSEVPQRHNRHRFFHQTSPGQSRSRGSSKKKKIETQIKS